MNSVCVVVIFLIILLIIIGILTNCYYIHPWYQQTLTPFYTPLERLPIVPNNIKPSRVCIFMVATPEINNYAQYSIEINKKYCKKHGYNFRIIDKNLTPDLSINFSKIQATLNIMNEKGKNGKSKFDYIIHVDADAIFHNQEYQITNIIAKYMNWPVSFLAGEDCYTTKACSKPGKMNSGVYIVKNNLFGKWVMKTWLSDSRGDCKKYATQFPSCQLVFSNCTIKKMFFAIRIIPYNSINGKDGLLLSHHMAHTDRERIDAMKDTMNTEFQPERMRVYN